METAENYQIITFYAFKNLGSEENLKGLRESLKKAMKEYSITGTIIIAAEGFNSSLCGAPPDIKESIPILEALLGTKLQYKSSFYAERPFRRIKVKIKPEIVTLKKQVEIEKGIGTHVDTAGWNEIINDSETFLLDTRNDYEVQMGTFKGAINPKTEKFSDLPKFVEENLDPAKHKKVAMFCTGGIRCEKFAPYMKTLGFEEVFQLEGGILKYLEETSEKESLWQGECFVFDDRISVDEQLNKGNSADLSQEMKKTK